MSVFVKGNAERVELGVGVGPVGVAVGVLEGVGVFVGVGVFDGNVGIGEGVFVGGCVFCGSGVAVGCGCGGVQVGCKGSGEGVDVTVGRAAATATVGGTISAAALSASKIAANGFSTSPGTRKTTANAPTAASETINNRAASAFVKLLRQPLRRLIRFALINESI